MTFRTIIESEYPLIAPIMQATIESEEHFSLPATASEEDCVEYLFSGRFNELWVLEEDGEVLGAYFQRRNQRGLGNHIANGSYMVSPHARGRGIGRRLGEHSIARAKTQGYRAMQFNFVISTNQAAVTLWKALGFAIIGTIPNAFHRKQTNYVDAYIMYKDLTI